MPFPWPALPSHLTWFDDVCIGTTKLGVTLASLHALFRGPTTWAHAVDSVPALQKFDVGRCAEIASECVRRPARIASGCTQMAPSRPPAQRRPPRAGWAVICVDPVASLALSGAMTRSLHTLLSAMH